ncbi:MAG: PQQ-binding-like beta-propeller repeat protein, partial [Blastocatellia bacterium]|nr:PQQ-binding-like beta-propeller repeat protein [Blastocatellia bacterium]
RGRRQNQKRQRVILKLENLPAAFAMKWKYVSNSTTKLAAVVDSETVYLPLTEGRIIALSAETGELKWENQIGGTVTSAPIVVEDSVVVASRQGAVGESVGGATLRAFNKSSGITLWSKDFPDAFSAAVVEHDKRLYIPAQDANLYVVSVTDGSIVWKKQLDTLSKARVVIDGEDLFIGAESGQLSVLALSDGATKLQFRAEGAIRSGVAVDKKSIYFGDSEGYVYAIERATGKLRWQIRTGAAVETTPQLAGKLLLAASFDNIVYGLEASSGDRIWKVRLQGRLSFEPLVEGDNFIVTPLASDRLFALSSKGKVLGSFVVSSGAIIAAPLLLDGQLYVVTDEGLVAAASQEIEKNEKK